jgi:hypothetical protein
VVGPAEGGPERRKNGKETQRREQIVFGGRRTKKETPFHFHISFGHFSIFLELPLPPGDLF